MFDSQEKDFLVPASDVRGHSARLQFRVHPGHAQQIDSVVAAKHFPYRSRGDLYRHALTRHLKWLEAIGADGIPSVIQHVEVIMEIVRAEEFRNELTMCLTG